MKILTLSVIFAGLASAQVAQAHPSLSMRPLPESTTRSVETARKPADSLPLQYAFKRKLPLGLRLDVAPGIITAKSGKKRGKLLGYSGSIALNAMNEFVVLKSNVSTRTDAEASRAQWSVQLTTGSGLKPPTKALLRQVLSGSRSILRRLR